MFGLFKKRREQREQAQAAQEMATMLREFDAHLAKVAYLQRVMDAPGPQRDQFMQLAMPAINSGLNCAAMDKMLGYDGDLGELVMRVASVLYVTGNLGAMQGAGYRPSKTDVAWMQLVLQSVSDGKMTPSLANFLPKAREEVAAIMAQT